MTPAELRESWLRQQGVDVPPRRSVVRKRRWAYRLLYDAAMEQPNPTRLLRRALALVDAEERDGR